MGIVLTQSNTFIIGSIAKLLGFIMNGIFNALSYIGIENIGLSIIIFTEQFCNTSNNKSIGHHRLAGVLVH